MKNIAILITLICLFGCFGKKPENTGLEGKPLPSFNLLLPDSTTYFNTNSISGDRPIVLYYFGPHCPYSHSQMKEIIEDMEILKDIQFYIFTATAFSDMKSFYEYYHLKKYSNIKTGLDYSHFFADYFQAPGVPYIAIYGKNKRLREAFIGKIYAKQIKKIAEE